MNQHNFTFDKVLKKCEISKNKIWLTDLLLGAIFLKPHIIIKYIIYNIFYTIIKITRMNR